MNSSEKRPRQVKEAIYQANHEALSAMGKVGGKHAALNRDLEKTKQEEEFARRALESNEQISKEGDVLPLDPNIAESLKEELRG